jgi:hypothetical protein
MTDLTGVRRWVAGWLHLWGDVIYDDWHMQVLKTPQGEQVYFSCYGPWSGTWPDDWSHTSLGDAVWSSDE